MFARVVAYCFADIISYKLSSSKDDGGTHFIRLVHEYLPADLDKEDLYAFRSSIHPTSP